MLDMIDQAIHLNWSAQECYAVHMPNDAIQNVTEFFAEHKLITEPKIVPLLSW